MATNGGGWNAPIEICARSAAVMSLTGRLGLPIEVEGARAGGSGAEIVAEDGGGANGERSTAATGTVGLGVQS